MDSLDIVFLCLLAPFVILQGGMLLLWLVRRRTLGAMLWTSDRPGWTLVYVWSALALIKIADIVFRSRHAGPVRLTTAFMMALIWAGLAYQALYPKGLVQIDE